jgi:mono/diheme cytochrome c family protein
MKAVGLLACAVVFTLAGSVAANAADGKALYGSKCAGCHGADGVPKKMAEGSKAFGSAEFKSSHNADAIAKVTLEGKGKMKPVKVTEEEAKAIAAYIVMMGAAK